MAARTSDIFLLHVSPEQVPEKSATRKPHGLNQKSQDKPKGPEKGRQKISGKIENFQTLIVVLQSNTTENNSSFTPTSAGRSSVGKLDFHPQPTITRYSSLPAGAVRRNLLGRQRFRCLPEASVRATWRTLSPHLVVVRYFFPSLRAWCQKRPTGKPGF